MKELVVKFIKKYPITFALITAFAVAMIIYYHIGDINIITADTKLISDLSAMFSCVALGSFAVHNGLNYFRNKLPEKITSNNVICNLVAALIAFVIYVIVKLVPFIYIGEDIDYLVFYGLITIFLALAYYFIIKENNIPLYEYVTKTFINLLALFLLECVVTAGIGVLFYIYYLLFGSVDVKAIAYVMMFQIIMISYTGVLIALEKIDGKLTLFSKVLIKYVMFIMVLIGFVFFYIYLIRIIISGKIPSNQAFNVCSILFAGGLSIALMSQSFDEGTIYDKIIKYLPIAFIPALFLQITSIVLRINQYGLTAIRYLGVMLIILEIVYLVIYFVKNEKLYLVIIAQAIIIAIMYYAPFVNVTQFPNIYNEIFSKQTETISTNAEDTIYQKEKVYLFHQYKTRDIDISQYNKLDKAQVYIEYDEKDKNFKYNYRTNEVVNDFKKVDLDDEDSKVIATIDVEKLLNDIKESIIKNDYSSEEAVIFKDMVVNIEYENKIFIPTEIKINFDVKRKDFDEVRIDGYLLTK